MPLQAVQTVWGLRIGVQGGGWVPGSGWVPRLRLGGWVRWWEVREGNHEGIERAVKGTMRESRGL